MVKQSTNIVLCVKNKIRNTFVKMENNLEEILQIN